MAEFSAELRTRHLPTLRVDSDQLAQPGESSPLVRLLSRWLRWELRIRHPFGAWTRAPHGPPGPSSWPLVGIVGGLALLAVLALAVVGLVSLLRR